MKKSFIIASIVGLGGLSMLQTACDNYDDLIPQQYNCILSLQKYGEQEVVLYRTGEDTKIEITTLKTGSVPNSTASASIKAMNEIQFEEYKALTGLDYKYLPQDCYAIEQGELSYEPDDKWKKSLVAIDYDKVESYFNATDDYVIPIMLTSDVDSCLSSRRELMLKISDLVIPSIGFTQTVVDYEEELLGDGTITIELPVKMPIENNWNFSYQVEVDASLAEDCQVAKSDAYTMEVGDFVAGENAMVKLTIDKSKLNFGRQAIPLRITSCDFSGFEISSTQSTAVVTFYKTVQRSELQEFTPTHAQITGWGWATYTYNWDQGYYISQASHDGETVYEGQGKTALFDGNFDTYWCGDYWFSANHSVYGQYIDFELSAPATHFAYDLWTAKVLTHVIPKVTDIYASADGQTWTKLKTIHSPMTDGGVKFESTVCSSGTPFNHIRFAVVESNDGDVHVPGKTWCCAEMKLYVK